MIGDTNYGRAKERGSTAAVMAAANPVLAPREFAATVDGTDVVLKIGDGVTPWNDLPSILPHPEGSGGGGGGSYIEADGPTPPTGQPDGTIWRNTSPAV